MVSAIDAKLDSEEYWCYARAGKEKTRWKLGEWLAEAERQGAGEVLLTSIERDGTGKGFDLAMLRMACGATGLPVIASGGCASAQDMVDVFGRTEASGALAASIFHFGRATVAECKRALTGAGIEVRT